MDLYDKDAFLEIAVSITTISSREFNQDAGGAKKAAEKGPVFITDRGRPAHVLLSFEAYQKLVGARRSLLEVVAQDEDDDIEFDPPRMGDDIARPVDFD
jgi:prevent-host-death family protein